MIGLCISDLAARGVTIEPMLTAAAVDRINELFRLGAAGWAGALHHALARGLAPPGGWMKLFEVAYGGPPPRADQPGPVTAPARPQATSPDPPPGMGAERATPSMAAQQARIPERRQPRARPASRPRVNAPMSSSNPDASCGSSTAALARRAAHQGDPRPSAPRNRRMKNAQCMRELKKKWAVWSGFLRPDSSLAYGGPMSCPAGTCVSAHSGP